MLEQFLAAPSQDTIIRKLTLDMLSRLPESVGESLRVATIPRYFNVDILAVALSVPHDQASTLCEEMRNFPFIQPYEPRGHIVFESVRAIILQEWTRPNRRSKYIKYNKRLADYYHKMCEVNPFRSRVEWAEAIYHQLAVDESSGFIWFEREFLRALEFAQYDHCAYLLETLTEKRDALSVTNRLWLDFYSGLLAEKLQRWKEAEEKYRALELHDGWPIELRAFLINKLITITREAQQSTMLTRKEITLSSSNRTNIDIESEIKMLEDFYRQKQNESRASFNLALAAAAIGFLTIIAGSIGAIFGNSQIAVVTSSAGIVTEITASLLFVQNSRARARMDECQKDLVKMRNLSRALQIASTAIESPSEREKRITGIVDELIDMKQS